MVLLVYCLIQYISGARIPYHFCFSIFVVEFNNWNNILIKSQLWYAIGLKDSNCWALGNVYQLILGVPLQFIYFSNGLCFFNFSSMNAGILSNTFRFMAVELLLDLTGTFLNSKFLHHKFSIDFLLR